VSGVRRGKRENSQKASRDRKTAIHAVGGRKKPGELSSEGLTQRGENEEKKSANWRTGCRSVE